jgi:hypothetical protein
MVLGIGNLRANLNKPGVDGAVLLITIACLLLAAAFLKIHEMLTVPFFALHPLDKQWLRVTAICGEGVLGIWLLSGVRLKTATAVTVVCFSVFFVYATFEAIYGAASCGCFGRLQTKPWITAGMDLSILLLIWRFGLRNPIRWNNASKQGMKVVAVLFPVGVLILAGIIFSGRAAASRGDAFVLDTSHRLVVLDEKQWIGKRFPLYEYCNIGGEMHTGRWIILIHRVDCPVCQRATAVYELAADASFGDPDAPRVAFLSLEPLKPSEKGLNAFRRVLRGALDSTHEWFAATPVAVELKDGIVVRAASETAAADLGWLNNPGGGSEQ